jgi:hypothetical protein
MDSLSKFNKSFNKTFGWLHDNKYVMSVLVIILTVYVTLVRPKLPTYIEKLFQNFYFRLIVISFILYKANNDMSTSVLLTFCFLFIIHCVNKQRVEKFIDNI